MTKRLKSTVLDSTRVLIYMKKKHRVCKILLFVCCIPSSRFGVEPTPTAHDRVFVVQRCNSIEFFFYWTMSHRRKIAPKTCLCCRRLLVGSGVDCIAIRIVTLTLVFFSLESLL